MIAVCESCLASYQKWVTRRQRHSGSGSAASRASESLRKKKDKLLKALNEAPADKPRRKHRSRRGRFESIGVIALISLAAYLSITMVVYVLISRSNSVVPPDIPVK